MDNTESGTTTVEHPASREPEVPNAVMAKREVMTIPLSRIVDIAIGIAVSTLVLCMALVGVLGRDIGHLPQISLTGVYPPEKYFFTAGMTTTACLLAVVAIISPSFLKDGVTRAGLDDSIWSCCAWSSRYIGLFSSVCLSFMGIMSLFEEVVVHQLMAAFFFIGVIIWGCVFGCVTRRVQQVRANAGMEDSELYKDTRKALRLKYASLCSACCFMFVVPQIIFLILLPSGTTELPTVDPGDPDAPEWWRKFASGAAVAQWCLVGSLLFYIGTVRIDLKGWSISVSTPPQPMVAPPTAEQLAL